MSNRHQWSTADKDGVQHCLAPDCTIRKLHDPVPTVWQRKPGAHWRSVTRTPLPPCVRPTTPEEKP